MRGEFIGFSFDGIHCSELGITRVSAGDRYTHAVFANITDQTQSVAGKIGDYYFGVSIGSKPFTLNIAFDDVNDWQFAQLSSWLSGERMGKLVFDEWPYKYYMAKISTNADISFLPFEVENKTEVINIYRGEGVIRFTAYHPFAYTNSIILNNFSDFNNVPYSIDHMPSWMHSAQLIPATHYNREGFIEPASSNLLYIGGMRKVNFDIELNFNSDETNSGFIIGDVAMLTELKEQTIQRIEDLTAERTAQETIVANLTAQRDEQITVAADNAELLRLNNDDISNTMAHIHTLNQTIPELQNKLVELNIQETDEHNLLLMHENKLQILNDQLGALLVLTDPSDIRLEQIAKLEEDIQAQIILISEQQLIYDAAVNARVDCEQQIEDAELDLFDSERLVEELKEYSIELQANINEANRLIAEYTEQLIAPTNRVIELNIQINDAMILLDNIEKRIEVLEQSGSELDGHNIVITRKAQTYKGVVYPEQKCTIKMENVLRNCTLRINATNHDVSYINADGRRFEYFDNFSGDFITAMPTGYSIVKRGSFDAGASLVNTIGLLEKLTESEKTYILDKHIVFKEDFRQTNMVSKVINIRENPDTQMDELVLSTGYSLTQGIRNFIVLEDFVEITLSDTWFLSSINFKFPYVYY